MLKLRASHPKKLIPFLLVALSGCGGGGSDGNTNTSIAVKSSSIASSSTSINSSSTVSSSSVSAARLGDAADSAIARLMTKVGATATTFAVAKNGLIIYEKAYGYKDKAKTIPLETTALIRPGSVLKPVTAAAVRELASNGVLALSDHVFCTGSNAPCWLPQDLLSQSTDPRVKDITLQHLISHAGGWYQDISGDPAFMEVEIKNTLNLSTPPSREQIIKYVMAKPLDFTPGSTINPAHNNFSNFGYMLLGSVIELASRASYTQFVQTEIMGPIGVSAEDFKAGESKLVDRDSREPAYNTNEKCISVYTGELAICAEEMREVRNWTNIAFNITTASAMALFAQHYKLPNTFSLDSENSGLPLDVGSYSPGKYMGDMEGVTSIVKQFPSGVSYALFLNVTVMRPELVSSMTEYEYYYNYLDEISQLAP